MGGESRFPEVIERFLANCYSFAGVVGDGLEREQKKVKCPGCGKEALWEKNPFRPFCSERCRLIDLGKWMDGSYVMPGESTDGEQEDVEH